MTLLQTEDITSIKQEVRELISNYNSETAKEKQLQMEAWQKDQEDKKPVETEEPAETNVVSAEIENIEESEEIKQESEEFEYVPNEHDEALEEAIATYKERVKEHGQKIAAEQKKNLEDKKAILTELKSLVQDEENISKAFQTFNELSEKWQGIGNVPGDKFQDLNDDYRKTRDDFFYNMSIYKQLRENDLLINEKKKVDLVEKIKLLKDVESIRECDAKLKEYRKEWDEIGPATRENYERLGDEFFGVFREIIEKIQKHYDLQREKQEENLALKAKVLEELKEALVDEPTQHNAWVSRTQIVLDLQAKWKTIGFGPKKENEELWQEFRGLCDLFFEKKQNYYSSRKETQQKSKDIKTALVQKAKEHEESTDWKKSTEALIQLQKEWKAAGPTYQKEEQSLWGSFRKSCDSFFNRKKEFFGNQDEIQSENLKAKKALIETIKAHELTGTKNVDLEKLRAFSDEWRAIGFVPRKNIQEINDLYHQALDAKYDKLKLDEKERSILQYKERISSIKKSSGGNHDLRREKRLMLDKIDRLKSRITQYENNVNFFSGAGAEKMKKDIEKKVISARREIDEIKAKLDLLDQN